MPEEAPNIPQIKWPKGSSKPGHKCANCYAPATERGHWKTHKEQCNQNSVHSESLAQEDIRLEKWIKYHNSTLMAATIHALALPRDLTRSRTHVVCLVVQPREDNDLPASKFFRVVEAEAIGISLRQTAMYHPCGKRGEEAGNGGSNGNRMSTSGVQSVPFGSLRDLSVLRILPNWKEIMTRDVESGKKFTKFG
ncbi:hypothetical protein DFH09DRAFT_1159138, partial [Mycena vulgaris]